MQTPLTLPTDWGSVLARVETALAQTVARLEVKEQALSTVLPTAPITSVVQFAGFDERLKALAAGAGRARQRLAQIDDVLREGEDSLRQWLTRAEAVRRRLAAMVDGAIR
jgi:hypothetical protein